ncbi:hypothetical protein D9M69_715520 [compost metagenome]
MAEQPVLAQEIECGRIAQSLHAAGLEAFGTQQEVAVASHEMHRGVQAERFERIGASAPEGLVGGGAGVEHVVTHPDLEQVAQDEEGVGPFVRGALQKGAPDLEGLRLAGLQVQV